jgi:cob(I)alamin adenosyltransferase
MSMNDLIGRGYVHIYTGNGKGKTTAALGLAFRAVGNGLKVLMFQFLKGEGEYTGEREAAIRLAPDLEIRARGGEGFVDPTDPSPMARSLAQEAIAEARREIQSGHWDLVILDEINVAVHLGLIPVQIVQDLLDARPEGVEIVLTGRQAPQELINRADLVTEMIEVKHYYNAGVPARKGIEK